MDRTWFCLSYRLRLSPNPRSDYVVITGPRGNKIKKVKISQRGQTVMCINLVLSKSRILENIEAVTIVISTLLGNNGMRYMR